MTDASDRYGCTMDPDGVYYICYCDWELCNGDLTLLPMILGILDKRVDPFDMTPAMINLRERLKNLGISPGDYKQRLDEAISSASYAADTHSDWVLMQHHKSSEPTSTVQTASSSRHSISKVQLIFVTTFVPLQLCFSHFNVIKKFIYHCLVVICFVV